MRVLFLTHRLPYAPNRGDRIRAYHILHTLAARWPIDLVSLVHDRMEEAHAPTLTGVATTVTTARAPRYRNTVRGLRSLPTGRPLTHALYDAPSLKPALRHLKQTKRPDVILALCSSMARFALELPLLGTPCVVDSIDVDSAKWADYARAARGPMRWVYTREARCLSAFEVFSARQAEATLVVNERERATLLRIAPDARVHVVPNGVDVDAYRPNTAPAGDPRVVFSGVMDYRPNEEAALWLARTVWPIVRARRPLARLSLVGANPTRAVRRLTTEDPTIEVTGAVPDVRPYLWRSAVAVAPIQIARGVQNKVLEAIAAGLPTVVSSAVSAGLPHEVTPACVVADAADDVATAIIGLLECQPAERQAVAARAGLRTLTWAHRLSPLFSILERAVQRKADANAPAGPASVLARSLTA